MADPLSEFNYPNTTSTAPHRFNNTPYQNNHCSKKCLAITLGIALPLMLIIVAGSIAVILYQKRRQRRRQEQKIQNQIRLEMEKLGHTRPPSPSWDVATLKGSVGQISNTPLDPSSRSRAGSTRSEESVSTMSMNSERDGRTFIPIIVSPAKTAMGEPV